MATGKTNAGGVADLSVTTEKIADKAVTTRNIADKAVTPGQLGDASVGTEKIKDGAVTRAKLAQNALISPTKWIITSPYNVVADDLEKTLICDGKLTTVQINISNELFAALPTGGSFAIIQWSTSSSTSLTITLGSDYWLNKEGERGGTKGGSITTNNARTMIVLKKITTSSLMVFGITDVAAQNAQYEAALTEIEAALGVTP